MASTHHEAKLDIELREKLGSRPARALRNRGRLPASLQFFGDSEEPLRHFSVEAAAFRAAHRHEAHLFDFEFSEGLRSGVIREIQWDLMGSDIQHIEFKGVVRGQRSDVRVPLSLVGGAVGTVNQVRDMIVVNCLPKNIPDMIEVNLETLALGAQLRPSALDLPEGITLSEDEAKKDDILLVIVEEKAMIEEVVEDDDTLDLSEGVPDDKAGSDGGGEGGSAGESGKET
ncbi:MAG TPA: 50S ribosomal protein L25 [Planctomycetes bacterium]|nr:50S ribosomal protein L25 [Planctomycetota bacterium]HIL37721.1 50S ribosomal protein L25 [Planctomycetota bacterium]